VLGRRSVPWTELPTCLIWGEAAEERREDSDPHPPHPRHDRDDQMTTTLSRSTRLCQTNGHDRWQDPPQGPSSSHSLEATTPGLYGWRWNLNQGRGTRKDTTWNPHSLVPVRKGREQQSHRTTRGCSLSRGVRFKWPPATGPIKPYSGFDEALKRWGPSGDITATRDLKWQRDVNGDMQKIKQFQEVVGGLQDFWTYLLMKPGSAFVTILHSPMKFVAISEATQHLQGRYVGFVGDRTATKDPTPVVLPQQSTWQWDTKTMSLDAAALEAHYAADPTRRGKLWAPDQADSDA